MKKTITTEQKILKAAVEIVNENNKLTIREVRKKAQVELPTIYHYFSNKEGLLRAVAEYAFENYLDLKEKSFTNNDPIQKIRDGWNAHTKYGEENPGLYSLMYLTDNMVRESEIISKSRVSLLNILKQASAEKRISLNPSIAAEIILQTNISVTLQRIADKISSKDAVEVREKIISLLTFDNYKSKPKNKFDNNLSAYSSRLLLLLESLNENDLATKTKLDIPEITLLKKWLTILKT